MKLNNPTSRRPACLLACLVYFCGSPLHAGSDDAEQVEYLWYNEGELAGEQTVTFEPGNRTVTDMRIRWNNRDFILHNDLTLDAAGFVVRQSLSGQSAFGATIDEQFTWDGARAEWSSPSGSGGGPVPVPAFYVPARSGATETIAALIRRGMASPGGRVPLLPAGEAQVERVTETHLTDGNREATVTLYSIGGLEFAPTYAWLDQDGRLFSHEFWGLSILPADWGRETADGLAKLRAEHQERHYEDIARETRETPSGAVVIEQVNVFDSESGTWLHGRDVVLRDGRIAVITEQANVQDDTRRIDGKGKYLIPGLWDMHAHTEFYSYHGGILNIAGGVTSVRDMGSSHDGMMAMSRRFDSGELVGPAVYRAGFIDKKSPYSASRAVDTFDEALARVHWYADHGYIQIKLYSSIDPDWVEPLAQAAHERGLRVGGHVPAFMNAEQAILQGFDEIQHINMVFLNFLADDTDDTRSRLRFYRYGDEAGNLDLDSPPVTEFIELLRSRGTVIDPTVAVFDSMIGHRAGQPNPLFTQVVDRFPIGEYRSMHAPAFEITADNAAAWDKSRQAALRMVRKLHDAGVPIVPGTDALPGFALHRELELYAQAGIPNAEILNMATLGSARAAGTAERTGNIEAGKAADLVLLCTNPLEDITALRRIAWVFRNGAMYRPEELHRRIGIRPDPSC